MRRVAHVLVLSLASAVSFAAEPLVPQHKAIDDDGTLTLPLQVGNVEITRNTVDGTGLFVQAGGGHEVMLESAHLPLLLKTDRNSALIALNTGDADCPRRFAWVTYDTKGLRTSGSFGTCAPDGEATFERAETGPVVTMRNRQYSGKTVSYRYNEATAELSRVMMQ